MRSKTSSSEEPATAADRTAAPARRHPGRARAGRDSRTRMAISLTAVLLVLVAWELTARFELVNPLFTSSPTKIASAFVELLGNGELARHGAASARLFGISFALSVGTALPLGIAIGWYPRLRAAADPFVSILYATPRIALIPLVIVWFGIGLRAQVVIVWLAAVFPLLINTIAGVENVDRRLLRVARCYMARDRDIFRTLALPTAVPYITAGLRLALIQALIGVVVAEFFVGNVGIGSLIVSAGLTLRTEIVFVGVFVMAAIALVLTALLRAAERHFARWKTVSE